MKTIIKKGDRFNRLVAVRFDHIGKNYQKYWLFKCDCGIEKVICVGRVKYGGSKSCGCFQKENLRERMTTHGMTKTGSFKSWSSMRQRCLDKNYTKYKNYGGRGITICKKWLNSFQSFYKDMGERPKKKSLDRINNNGNYCKENCRWATIREQMNNTSRNRFLTYKNKTQTIAQWAKELNITYATLSIRINRYNWSDEKSLN